MSSSLLPTILVANNKFDFDSALFAFLNNREFEITLVKDSTQMQASLAAGYFDLVLLDANLPELNQLNILKSLYENHPKTVVMMLFGENDMLDYAFLFLNYNIYDFIHKSSDTATLHKIIYAALTERRFRVLPR